MNEICSPRAHFCNFVQPEPRTYRLRPWSKPFQRFVENVKLEAKTTGSQFNRQCASILLAFHISKTLKTKTAKDNFDLTHDFE